jgi:predicted lysophospholipase L1 biosynthesis ABC-type transport system permease subunit
LALLKTLGFTERQLAATVAWQASVAAVIGIVVGSATRDRAWTVALDPV